MFRIEKNGRGGFTIHTGDRRRGGYNANTVDQVKHAVDHHFKGPTNPSALGRIDQCPLCP